MIDNINCQTIALICVIIALIFIVCNIDSNNEHFESQTNTSTQPSYTPPENTSTQPPYTPPENTSTQPSYTPPENTSTQPSYTPPENTSTQPQIMVPNYQNNNLTNYDVEKIAKKVFDDKSNDIISVMEEEIRDNFKEYRSNLDSYQSFNTKQTNNFEKHFFEMMNEKDLRLGIIDQRLQDLTLDLDLTKSKNSFDKLTANDTIFGGIKISKNFSGYSDNNMDGSEIANDVSDYKQLLIVGNKSAGGLRQVGILDQLNVKGNLCIGDTCMSQDQLKDYLYNQSILRQGESLFRSMTLRSPNGLYRLVHQNDGNVVIYKGNVQIWSTGTSGFETTKLTLDKDGDLALYTANNSDPIWKYTGKNGYYVQLQDNGNFIMVGKQNYVIPNNLQISTFLPPSAKYNDKSGKK
jgi:hypothetical protein